MKNIAEHIACIQNNPLFNEAIVYHRHIPPKEPRYGEMPSLPLPLKKALSNLGIRHLYSHQTDALNQIRNNKNVIVSTSTSSGKSLIYNLAVTEKIIKDPNARAIYIFPLKALAQDQNKTFSNFTQGLTPFRIETGIYDGDTSVYTKKKIRARSPHVIFTNPDMLHMGILPYHESWQPIWKNLSFVVIDEVHTYRGIFGSHVNQIIRRLKRICRHYGSHPQFILLSATISNPKAFGSKLIGEDITVVDNCGSPEGERHFLLLNPVSGPGFTAAQLFVHAISKGFKTIAFTQSRRLTELIHIWVNRLAPHMKRMISSYRAGFLPKERRIIEKKLVSGKLLGIISTSALEMGIDIGDLDVCLLVGYPGTMINTWQRSGRVGRSGKSSLVILLSQQDALDQYFMKHPEELFQRSFESAILDPDNPFVVRSHLPCAASEIPLTRDDERYWGSRFFKTVKGLEGEGKLVKSEAGEPVWLPCERNPHLKVNIRTSGQTFTIFETETGQAIGTIDGIRAFKECHPGAIYLHRSSQYLVDRLIIEKKDIIVHRTGFKYFTRPRSEKDTEIIKTDKTKSCANFNVHEGELRVTEIITGYEKRSVRGQELLGVFPLDLPENVFETRGLWIEVSPVIKRHIKDLGLSFMGGIHAIEHAVIGLFPIFVLCDRNDIAGICYPFHPQVQRSAIFIYDTYPGGAGLSSHGYEVILELLERTLDHVQNCDCDDGCPSCIHSPKCGSGNKPLDKEAAIKILDFLVGNISKDDLNKKISHGTNENNNVSSCDSGINTYRGQKSVRKSSQKIPAAHEPHGEISKSLEDLRIIFFDLETKRLAYEVGGWQNSHLMGISVAVIFDSMDNRFEIFYENRVQELIERLKIADLIVGFNVKGFDYKVLKGYTDIDISKVPTFDILEDIHARLGYRLGLDHLAKETLKQGKIATGVQAVAWYRQGKLDKLASYCMQDVAVTRDLFLYGLKHGVILYRQKKTNISSRLIVNWDIDRILNKIARGPIHKYFKKGKQW